MENKLECRRGTLQKDEVVKLESYFPEEIITEILLGLPVKSLLRFRCFSKSYCTFIDSPYFTNLHLNKSARNRSHIKLIFMGEELISTNYNSAKLCVSYFDNDLFKHESLADLRVYGYCNGVFLLKNVDSFNLYLWNPSTQQHRLLPCYPDHKLTGFTCTMGFGYDSTRDDYKVVLVNSSHQVWIFGLKSNSWKRVQTNLFPGSSLFQSFENFANGDLYMLCNNSLLDIVAFDVAKERFSLVAQPDYPTDENRVIINLHVLDGNLCISFVSELAKLARLYIRKKDGHDFTWGILYSVTQAQLPRFLDINCFKKMRVLGYSDQGDHKIMLNLGFWCMISYNLKEKSFESTNITCLSNDSVFGRPCFESLVSIDGGEGLQRQLIYNGKGNKSLN